MQSINVWGSISYEYDSDSFIKDIDTPYVAKYFKGIFRNVERFDEAIYHPVKAAMKALEIEGRIGHLDMLRYYFQELDPFTYKEAFAIENATFRATVFGSINVGEMIANLGHERLKVEGKNVNHRVYKMDGSYEMKNYDVVYELHKINCTALGLENPNYCVKCWCTTTNKEHWLWVEEEYALKGPLEAIASTVRVYENMIPHIKYIKRQGDVLLFEMEKEVKPSGNIVPLTADQYFSKLIAQS